MTNTSTSNRSRWIRRRRRQFVRPAKISTEAFSFAAIFLGILSFSAVLDFIPIRFTQIGLISIIHLTLFVVWFVSLTHLFHQQRRPPTDNNDNEHEAAAQRKILSNLKTHLFYLSIGVIVGTVIYAIVMILMIWPIWYNSQTYNHDHLQAFRMPIYQTPFDHMAQTGADYHSVVPHHTLDTTPQIRAKTLKPPLKTRNSHFTLPPLPDLQTRPKNYDPTTPSDSIATANHPSPNLRREEDGSTDKPRGGELLQQGASRILDPQQTPVNRPPVHPPVLVISQEEKWRRFRTSSFFWDCVRYLFLPYILVKLLLLLPLIAFLIIMCFIFSAPLLAFSITTPIGSTIPPATDPLQNPAIPTDHKALPPPAPGLSEVNNTNLSLVSPPPIPQPKRTGVNHRLPVPFVPNEQRMFQFYDSTAEHRQRLYARRQAVAPSLACQKDTVLQQSRTDGEVDSHSPKPPSGSSVNPQTPLPSISENNSVQHSPLKHSVPKHDNIEQPRVRSNKLFYRDGGVLVDSRASSSSSAEMTGGSSSNSSDQQRSVMTPAKTSGRPAVESHQPPNLGYHDQQTVSAHPSLAHSSSLAAVPHSEAHSLAQSPGGLFSSSTSSLKDLTSNGSSASVSCFLKNLARPFSRGDNQISAEKSPSSSGDDSGVFVSPLFCLPGGGVKGEDSISESALLHDDHSRSKNNPPPSHRACSDTEVNNLN